MAGVEPQVLAVRCQVSGVRRQASRVRISFDRCEDDLGHILHFDLSIAANCPDAVFEHRCAEGTGHRHDVSVGLQGLLGTLYVHALVGRLVDETETAAATAAKTLLTVLLHLQQHIGRRVAQQLARLGCNTIVPTQVAGIVQCYLSGEVYYSGYDCDVLS